MLLNILQSNKKDYVNTAVGGVYNSNIINTFCGFLYFKTILNNSFQIFPFCQKIILNSNNTQKDNINKLAIKFININPNLHASYTACKRNFLPYSLLLFPFINLIIHGILKPCIALFLILFYKIINFDSARLIRDMIKITKLLLIISGLFYTIMLCSLLVGNFIYINLSLFQNIGVCK